MRILIISGLSIWSSPHPMDVGFAKILCDCHQIDGVRYEYCHAGSKRKPKEKGYTSPLGIQTDVLNYCPSFCNFSQKLMSWLWFLSNYMYRQSYMQFSTSYIKILFSLFAAIAAIKSPEKATVLQLISMSMYWL